MSALDLQPLTAAERRWIDHVQANVVGRLALPARERARAAAEVVWWGLKEGTLDVRPNPWRHSLCGTRQLGDLETCAGMWQAGLAGVQVHAFRDDVVRAAAARTYPGEGLESILRRIARDAGVDGATEEAIAESEGLLQRSWLLRDPAISIPLQRPNVATCLRSGGAPSWCFGSWDTARRFASDPGRIASTIGALEGYFGGAVGRSWVPVALVLGAAGLGWLYFTPGGNAARRTIRRNYGFAV